MAILIIAESPKKVKTIGPVLGGRYTVMAGTGYVRDLSGKEMGLEPPVFELPYEAIERGRSVLAKLKVTVEEANDVILVTDSDRGGEAISQHLAEVLSPKNSQRVIFTAITKDRILVVFAELWLLDMQRAYAQEVRRALDRITGYRVSPALSDVVGQKVGAGRAQSSAIRLIVDLERAITTFKSTQHYGVELAFINEDATSWKAQFDTKSHLVLGETYLLDDKLVKLAAVTRGMTVAEYSDSEENKAPKALFTASTLQQTTGQRLKLKPKETMSAAQSLYDQGFITYLCIDSPNIGDEGVANIATYAQSVGLPLAGKQRKWKVRGGAQEGHEATRPTHAKNLDCGADAAEKALYRPI